MSAGSRRSEKMESRESDQKCGDSVQGGRAWTGRSRFVVQAVHDAQSSSVKAAAGGTALRQAAAAPAALPPSSTACCRETSGGERSAASRGPATHAKSIQTLKEQPLKEHPRARASVLLVCFTGGKHGDETLCRRARERSFRGRDARAEHVRVLLQVPSGSARATRPAREDHTSNLVRGAHPCRTEFRARGAAQAVPGGEAHPTKMSDVQTLRPWQGAALT